MPERRSCLRGSLLASKDLAWGLFMAQAHPRATQIGGSLWCFFRGVSGHIQRYARPVPSQKQQGSNCPSQPYLVSFCFPLLPPRQSPWSPSLFCHSEYFFGIVPCPLCHHLVPCAVPRGCHVFRSEYLHSQDKRAASLQLPPSISLNTMRPCKRRQHHRTILPRTNRMAATHH
jgi:hypothetical protein